MPVEVIVKSLFILLVVVAALAPVITWIERKQSAVMQDRIGANRADIAGITVLGLLHPLADVIKLLTKEDVVPDRREPRHAPDRADDRRGAGGDRLRRDPVRRRLHASATRRSRWSSPISTGACSTSSRSARSPPTARVLAGWASNNNWSLLGGLRVSAQMISYEVTMGLSVVGVFMVFETLKLTDMAIAQDTTFRLLRLPRALFGLPVPAWLDWIRLPAWGIFYQPLGFVMFLTAIMAENKRPPFDMPEGESEIIAGYHLEYSGMRFGLFYMSEFIEVVVIAGAGRDALPGRLGDPLSLAGRRSSARSRVRLQRATSRPGSA